jgi:murein DD-endopeptidase MepM/ murein hydrolase activator NlpD
MSKLSVHYNDQGNKKGFGDFLKSAKPAIVYSVNGNIKPDIIKNSPNTKLVYRRQTGTFHRLPDNFFLDNPEQNATDWLLNIKDPTDQDRSQIENWLLNPADYYDPLNEPVPQTVNEAEYLNRWMIKALEIAHSHGLKLALFSFAFGTPDYGIWQYLIQALQLGKQYGAILSLHEYSKSGPMMEAVDKEFVLRYRKVYTLLPDSAKLPLIISEASPDNGYGMTFYGQAWVDDMATYDAELMKDSFVLSACGFQLGGNESNLVDALPNLTQYIVDHPTPPIEEEMKLNYVVTGYLAPQNASIELLKKIQDDAYATKSTVGQSADDIRALVTLGLPGSKAIIYDPESWPGGKDGITRFFSGCQLEFRYTQTPPISFASPIKDVPYRVTSHFNEPRAYGNKLHEGMDLDCWDDTKAKAVNVYAALGGVVEDVVTVWSGTGYGIHVVVKHDWYGTTYKTWYCHLASTNAVKGSVVHQGDLLGVGGSTGASEIHLHFMIQKIPGGLSGYVTPYVIDPEPITIPNTVSQGFPAKRGVGMGNRAILTSKELEAIKVSKVDGFLALTMPSVSESQQIVDQVKSVNPNTFIVGRLFFSADYQNRTLFSPQDFVSYCKNGLDGLYSKGVRYFQIHNEPNLEQEGMGWNWYNGVGFGNWLVSVLNILKPMYPEAKWGYPGLSPQPNTEKFWQDSKFAMDKCDWVGVHAYWQFRGTTGWGMESLDGGYHYKRLSTSKPIMITEFSNNSGAVSYDAKGLEYKDYYKLVNIPAFSFCLSWNSDPNKEGWVYSNAVTNIPIKVGT